MLSLKVIVMLVAVSQPCALLHLFPSLPLVDEEATLGPNQALKQKA